MAQLKVTYIEKFNHYLRIYGQFSTQSHQEDIIRKQIEGFIYKGKLAIPEIADLHVGMMCLAKRFHTYCRATVLVCGENNEVLVHFIDYGDCDSFNVHGVINIYLCIFNVCTY